MEALHTREVKNTHTLLANHLNYIRRISLLENATAVMSFECARNAIETLISIGNAHILKACCFVSLRRSNLAFESQQCVAPYPTLFTHAAWSLDLTPLV